VTPQTAGCASWFPWGRWRSLAGDEATASGDTLQGKSPKTKRAHAMVDAEEGRKGQGEISEPNYLIHQTRPGLTRRGCLPQFLMVHE
jgi:hypothetical protein